MDRKKSEKKAEEKLLQELSYGRPQSPLFINNLQLIPFRTLKCHHRIIDKNPGRWSTSLSFIILLLLNRAMGWYLRITLVISKFQCHLQVVRVQR